MLTLPFWPPHCSFALTEALIYGALLAVASRPLHAYLASRLAFIAPPEEDPIALQRLHSAHLLNICNKTQKGLPPTQAVPAACLGPLPAEGLAINPKPHMQEQELSSTSGRCEALHSHALRQKLTGPRNLL